MGLTLALPEREGTFKCVVGENENENENVNENENENVNENECRRGDVYCCWGFYLISTLQPFMM